MTRSITVYRLACVLGTAALSALLLPGTTLAGQPTDTAAALQTQLREALPDAELVVDCFMARRAHCDDAAERADDFDHHICMATPLPAPQPLDASCRWRGDVDGDGVDDVIVAVHRETEGSPRGLVVLEADGQATLFGAGVSTELPLFIDGTEPDETFTLGPDLDWPVAATLLTHQPEPDLRAACAQLVPRGRAGLRLSGTDAAVLLVQGDEGGWRLVHCGF